jgi:hypothetical protein
MIEETEKTIEVDPEVDLDQDHHLVDQRVMRIEDKEDLTVKNRMEIIDQYLDLIMANKFKSY